MQSMLTDPASYEAAARRSYILDANYLESLSL